MIEAYKGPLPSPEEDFSQENLVMRVAKTTQELNEFFRAWTDKKPDGNCTCTITADGEMIKHNTEHKAKHNTPEQKEIDIDEDSLKELFEFATGKGKFEWTGPYMHTHPGFDETQDKLHLGCVELERRGLLKRNINEPHHVSWVEA